MGSTAGNPPQRISDHARRARLVARHHLDRGASGVEEAARDLVALHSTDPLTPYLSLRARVAGFELGDLDRALLADRTLVRVHAMRRTLFVVPTGGLPIFDGAVARDIARRERRRLEGWIQAEHAMEAEDGSPDGGGSDDGSHATPEWLSGLEERILDALAAGDELLTRELGQRIPDLATRITLGSGKWTTRAPISSRVLFLMAMEGRIVRTRPAGSWRSSQYRWADVSRWLEGAAASSDLGEPRMTSPSGEIERRTASPFTDPARARVELLRRYLSRFGPVTLDDIRWWTGWGAGRARAALAEVDSEPVGLEGGGEGFVLRNDLDDAEHGIPETSEGRPVASAASVAFLPSLDPTVMGWKHRGWYLGPHADALFDRNGNAGPTIWVDGRVVGGWGLSAVGSVAFRILEPVPSEVEDRVAEEAASLQAWLRGDVITPRFRTPLEKRLRE